MLIVAKLQSTELRQERHKQLLIPSSARPPLRISSLQGINDESFEKQEEIH